MGIRLLGAPRWQRWLVHFCVAAVFFGLIAPVTMPHLLAGMSRPWQLLVLGGCSVLFAALMMAATAQASREFVAATRDLSHAEKSQAITASVRGEVPATVPVLVAALRVGAIRIGHGRSSSTRIAVIYGLLFVSWFLLTLGAASADGTRQTVLKGAFTALIGIAGARGWFVARRVEQRIVLLRAELERHPDAAGALDAVQPIEPVSRRPVLVLVTATVLVSTGALAAVYLARGPTTDCHTVADMERFIASHRDMVDPAFISSHSAGPSLADYQGWSGRLRQYAASVSAPDVAPHVRRIAELSAQAVAVVGDARADPVSAQESAQAQLRTAYGGFIANMLPELKALDASCPRRR